MVLNLHTRLAHMKNCAIILVSSLPTAWIAVGALLLILALVMTVRFLLKSREVTVLKKQCEDLRETMRMMRYEEANLARMLHTASKPTTPLAENPVEELPIAGDAVEPLVDSVTPIAEELVENAPEACDDMSEEPAETSSEEALALTEETQMPADEMAATEEAVEPIAQMEDDEPAHPFENEDVVEPLVEGPLAEEPAVETPLSETYQVENLKPHKQPINERRPAIPTDLFSAWFAENEEVPVAEETASQTEPDATECSQVEESPAVSDELAAVVEASMTEESQTDTPQAPVESPQADVATVTEAPTQEVELSKEDERFCRKLERIVDTRLRNPNLNIDIIAAQFGIGRTNFYRKVRELTGMSPNDYLRKCRMERAAELLRTTDLPISEVCVQVGVPDAQYFSKVFKIYFATTPSIYREQTK